MVSYTAKQIEGFLGAKALLPQPSALIEDIITDTRKIHNAQHSLFFALTATRDGHNYIDEAYKAGIRNFVISKPLSLFERFTDANFFNVQDTLEALQSLAAKHRAQYNIPVIGITGSNGKTIVKEWLHHLLKLNENIVRSPKSYNSQIGVPLSVWQMDGEHTLGIFEAGISAKGEMLHLQKIIKPTVGIFTNLGDAHSEGFADKREKAAEKALLFMDCEKLVYCEDNYWILEAIDELHAYNPKLKAVAWSVKNNQCPYYATIETKTGQTSINLHTSAKKYSFSIPFTDAASVENTIHCAVTLSAMGYELAEYKDRFADLAPVEMRLQLKKGLRNCDVINDAYNADLNSLGIALDFLKSQKQHEKTVVILSDINQTGLSNTALYTKVAALVNEKTRGQFIGIGGEISAQRHLFSATAEFYDNTKEFLGQFNFSSLTDATILVKGSRSFRFEKIIQRLEEKTHETVLEINLTALSYNLAFFRSLLKPDTKIMAMVKAYSYGSGSYETANVLQFHGADYFAVAYADEGIELRKKGISLPIMVMNPGSGQFAEMLEYYLEPEIFNFSILDEFLRAFDESAQAEASIHLEFDTGMHRLGFEEGDIDTLLEILKNRPEIKVASVFSHLAAADEPQHDAFTNEQIRRFRAIKNRLQPHLPQETLFHICNSAGIARFPEAHMDMVRLGIGLYGIDATTNYQSKLQTAFRLRTTISQVREIGMDESVGYARNGMQHEARRIAVVAIGYADGLRRELSNGKGRMKINGQWAPIVGNVCMDMCMLDVSKINCHEGDEAVLFETNAEIIEFAQRLNTIPYEVLTDIGPRVKRVYWQE